MSGGRDRVLGDLRRSLKRDGGDSSGAEINQRLAEHPRNLIPGRAQLPPEERIALFRGMLAELSATSAQVASADEVPAAVADYLKSENLPANLRMAPDPALEALPWADQPLLEITSGPARESDPVSLTGALAGIAESGTLLLHSGPAGPTTLNFLPENHIVVLDAGRVLATYEDGWDQMRARFGEGTLPRTVNWITGPSRTGDIEQTIQLGAHGPRRLHVILVGEAAGEPA